LGCSARMQILLPSFGQFRRAFTFVNVASRISVCAFPRTLCFRPPARHLDTLPRLFPFLRDVPWFPTSDSLTLSPDAGVSLRSFHLRLTPGILRMTKKSSPFSYTGEPITHDFSRSLEKLYSLLRGVQGTELSLSLTCPSAGHPAGR
jgi:hypothetical protein